MILEAVRTMNHVTGHQFAPAPQCSISCRADMLHLRDRLNANTRAESFHGLPKHFVGWLVPIRVHGVRWVVDFRCV